MKEEICPFCLHECDPELCWCGTLCIHHSIDSGHSPVPMGCTCGYAKAQEMKNKTPWKISAKFPISTGNGKGGKLVIPKGTKGFLIPMHESKKIAKAFSELKERPDGCYYICCFPSFIDELLCDRSQIEFENE